MHPLLDDIVSLFFFFFCNINFALLTKMPTDLLIKHFDGFVYGIFVANGLLTHFQIQGAYLYFRLPTTYLK